MPSPIFEQTTSPLTFSNDGLLMVVRGSHDELPSIAWEVIDRGNPAGDRTLLRTYERVLCDAYIAGYDLAWERLDGGRDKKWD